MKISSLLALTVGIAAGALSATPAKAAPSESVMIVANWVAADGIGQSQATYRFTVHQVKGGAAGDLEGLRRLLLKSEGQSAVFFCENGRVASDAIFLVPVERGRTLESTVAKRQGYGTISTSMMVQTCAKTAG